jgi:uncharacterized protein with beta-barrel porin domain
MVRLPACCSRLFPAPNGGTIANALGAVLGGNAVQPGGTSLTTYDTLGPAGPIPVGFEPGTSALVPGAVNCNGRPSGAVWPVPNCNFTGYGTVFVPVGTQNLNVNTDFGGPQITVAANRSGLNWLSGDLYTTIQTTLLDDGLRFVDGLLGRGRGGGATGLFSPMPMGFAPAALSGGFAEHPLSDDALGYVARTPANKPPPPGTAPIGGGWSAWLAGSGAFAQVSGSASNFGFGYRTSSVSGGMEKRDGVWLYGGAFAVNHSGVSQDTTGDHAAIDTVRLGVYSAYQPGPFTATGALAYGNHAIGADRLNMLPGLGTQTNYRANSLDAGLEISKNYWWSGATIQPMLGLIYNGLWTNNFVENGGSLLGLIGNSAYVAALKGYAGGRVFHTFISPNGWEVTPEARARVLYDFLNDTRGFNATFAFDPTATAFAVAGLQPDCTAALLGAGLTVQVAPLWRAFATYDAELRGGDTIHIVSGGVRANW